MCRRRLPHPSRFGRKAPMARDYDSCGCRNERILRSRSIAVTPGTPTWTAHLFLPRMSEIRLHVNGLDHVVAIDDPLYVLRDDLALHGPEIRVWPRSTRRLRRPRGRGGDTLLRHARRRYGRAGDRWEVWAVPNSPAVQRRVFERQPDPCTDSNSGRPADHGEALLGIVGRKGARRFRAIAPKESIEGGTLWMCRTRT